MSKPRHTSSLNMGLEYYFKIIIFVTPRSSKIASTPAIYKCGCRFLYKMETKYNTKCFDIRCNLDKFSIKTKSWFRFWSSKQGYKLDDNIEDNELGIKSGFFQQKMSCFFLWRKKYFQARKQHTCESAFFYHCETSEWRPRHIVSSYQQLHVYNEGYSCITVTRLINHWGE